MFTCTLSIPWARRVWITCSAIPMLRMKIFIAGSEFLCSKNTVTPRVFRMGGRCGDPVDEPRPGGAVGGLEGVVVALDPRPDDELRPQLPRQLDPLERQPERRLPGRVVGRGKPTLRKARIEVQPARETVDPMPPKRLLHRRQVLAGELLRIVELVIVHQPAQPRNRRLHLLHRRDPRQLRLIPTRIEPRRHRPKRPNPQRHLHAPDPNLRGSAESNCLFGLDSERQIRER